MWSPKSVELVDVVIHFENIMADVDPKFAHLFPKRKLNFDFQNKNDENYNYTCDGEEPVIINEVHGGTLLNNRSSIQDTVIQSPVLNNVPYQGLVDVVPLLNSNTSEGHINDVPHSNSPINTDNFIIRNEESFTTMPHVSPTRCDHNLDAVQIDNEKCEITKDSSILPINVNDPIIIDEESWTSVSHGSPASYVHTFDTVHNNDEKCIISNGSAISPINIDEPITFNEGSCTAMLHVSPVICIDNTVQIGDEKCKNSVDSAIAMEDVEVVYDNTNEYETCESSYLLSTSDPVESSIEKADVGNSFINDNCMDEIESEEVYQNNNLNNLSLKGCQEESPNDMLQESGEEMSVSNTVEKWSEACQNGAECILKDCSLMSDNSMYDDCKDNLSSTWENSSCEVEYDFTNIPYQITGSWKEFNCNSRRNNFTRGCKWAPDGSCVLTCSDDNILRIFNMPSQLWDSSQWCDISEMEAAVKITEGESIYDYSWYPLMNSNDAATCCLASTSRKSTVHLWDGFTGELRCSYRPYNHLDEVVTPHSLSFDADGQRLFCGFKNIVRIFNVGIPGRSFESRHVFAKKSGQSGIISCFAFTSSNTNISVAGSYQKTIGIYSEPSGELECVLEGQNNGITQLQFSPDGKYLYSGGRKDPDILCWDLRNLGTILFSLKRSCETNQRMYFDISRCGKYVVSGNGNGIVTFWDVTKEPEIVNDNDYAVLKPCQFFLGHNDCVNGTSLHPTFPLLCSSSGQRKFPVLLDDDEKAMFSSKFQKCDNSLRLWWIGKCFK